MSLLADLIYIRSVILEWQKWLSSCTHISWSFWK